MLEEAIVRGGGGVVELVYDHDVEVVGLEVFEVFVGEFLDGGEEVIALGGLVVARPHVAELTVFKDGPECSEALFEDLFAVGYEKESGATPTVLDTLVVETSHHGLARAGGGHHQVLPTPMNLTFGLELFQNVALERVGGDVESVLQRFALSLLFDGADEAFTIPVGEVGLEFGVLPVRLEGGLELLEDAWVFGVR